MPQLPHIEATVDCSRIACTRWFVICYSREGTGGCEEIGTVERTLCLCRRTSNVPVLNLIAKTYEGC